MNEWWKKQEWKRRKRMRYRKKGIDNADMLKGYKVIPQWENGKKGNVNIRVKK